MSSLVDTISSNFVTVRFSYEGITDTIYKDIRSYIDNLKDSIYLQKLDSYFYMLISNKEWLEGLVVFKFPEDAAVFKLKFNLCFIE